MTYAWSSRDRLCPMRMVWHERNYNDPRFELRRLEHRMGRGKSLARNRVERPSESRVEADRWSRRRFPGLTGEQPLQRKAKRRRPHRLYRSDRG
jgi:hypothetical protein